MNDKFKHWRAEWENSLTLGLNTAKNTFYMKKSLKQKLLRIQFPTKICGRTCLSPTIVGLRDSKDCHIWNIIILKRENRLTSGFNTAKNTDYYNKKDWSKSCWEFNFLQKNSVSAHVYLIPKWSLWAWKIAIFDIL